MRISTTMMMNSYAKTLNEKYEDINKYSNQVSSTMAFERASDDPVAAMQTIKACHEYTLNQQNQSSESQASSWMTSTESTLTEINSVLTTAQEKATEAVNGTNSSTDLTNYAVAFGNYRDEIVTALNSTYNGQYTFGESTTSNSADATSGKEPFKIGTQDDVDSGAITSSDIGKLLTFDYNAKINATPKYVPVSSLSKTDVTAMKLTMPVDLGTGSNFDASTSGLDTIISSYDSSGKATNIVDQLTSVVNGLNSTPQDTSGLSSLISNVGSAQNAVLKVNVDVGEKSNMLSTISTKLTDTETNITGTLANCMEVDSTQAIMKYNMSETVYKESMSMASTVLQQSLFDFLK